jgi:hypothetical protein
MTQRSAIPDGSLDGDLRPQTDAVPISGREAAGGPLLTRIEEDERPQGWGICARCGEDCDDEADYDPQRRISVHAVCEDRRNSTPTDYSGEAA